MKRVRELLEEKRWPDDSEVWPIQWNRAAGLVDLLDHIQVRHCLQICEVGVAKGVSTDVFSRYGNVLGVDITLWGEAQERFKDRENVKLLGMDSFAAADTLQDASFDLIYLDSRHDYEWVRDEIRAWMPKVKKGGWISGHDYSPEFPGVQKAVAEVLGGPDRVYRDSSWIVQIQ